MLPSVRILASRIRSVLARRRDDAEFSAELASHNELLTEEFVRLGMRPEDARFAALRKLGRPTEIAETNRELRGLPVAQIPASGDDAALVAARRQHSNVPIIGQYGT